MAIAKVMGIETEYGISSPGDPGFNPVMGSSLLIGSYAGALRKIRWDYEQESPMRDARLAEPPPPRPLPEDEAGLPNVLLPNGARFYVDHAHPEYSTPECRTPRELVAADAAGERIVERALAELPARLPDLTPISIHKNNSDGKGNSYGTHENYLVDRAVGFADIVRGMIPFFVSRQIFTGAGKLGSEGPWGGDVTYQLTQRADFFEAEVGLETTLKRPIINTRDEPHADPRRYRRLHVIVGDANMSQVATLLKVGTTSLVLRMLEDGVLPDVVLAEPVAAMRQVSRDLTCREVLEVTDGPDRSALDLQWDYLRAARAWARTQPDDDDDAEILDRWEAVLTGLEGDPMGLAEQVDWVAKYRLLEGYRDRDGLAWGDPRLRMIDLQYHDVRREKGLAHRLEAAGKLERVVADEVIDRAVHEPPETTRAWFRGRMVGTFPDAVVAGSWDSLIIDIGEPSLKRLPMREPLRGTKLHTEDLLAQAGDAAELLRLLGE